MIQLGTICHARRMPAEAGAVKSMQAVLTPPVLSGSDGQHQNQPLKLVVLDTIYLPEID